MHSSNAYPNGGMALLILYGLRKFDAEDATPNAAHGMDLTAAQRRESPQRQKFLLFASNKNLKRMGGERSVKD